MKETILAFGLLAGILFVVSVPSSCYYDNEIDLYGADTTLCDTANLRYSVEIRKIMQDHCDECHISTSPTFSGIPFETHAEFKAVAMSGALLDRINNAGNPMPQTGLMLICNRQKIEAWVKAGAPNN